MHLDFGNIGIDEVHLVDKALCDGMVSTATPQVTEFEQKIAGYLNMPDAVATNSGTAALHLALLVCGVGPGDEVILPALTFIATANAVCHTGAKPVFVDVDRDTWNIDPDLVTQAITDKTKAIIPVHLYGNPCDMGALYEATKGTQISIIEDAAESLGATYQGMQTGTIGDVGCFSFNGNKTMTTGGGGLLVSNDPEKILKARCLSMQGRNKHGIQVDVGYNYKMTGLAASLGLAQFDRLQEFLVKKEVFHLYYTTILQVTNKDIKFQIPTAYSISSWWYTACAFKEEAETIQNKLSALAIPTRRVFKPIPYELPYYDGNSYPDADYIYRHGLCLPSSTLNTIEDIDKVCEAIKGVL